MANVIIANNTVLQSGDPFMQSGLRTEGVMTNCVPGALAQVGTTSDDFFIVCANEGRPIGVIAYRATASPYTDGHTIATAFADGEYVTLFSGPHWFRGIIAANQGPMVHGQLLAPAADGQMKKQTAATVTPCAELKTDLANSANAQRAVASYLLG